MHSAGEVVEQKLAVVTCLCILILIKYDILFIIENIKSGECYEESGI